MESETKTVAMLYGRMNPPTKGHEENINGLKELAAKHNADHIVIASHSHDAKKNPLSPEEKQKHLERAFPGTNIKVASKEHPTIMQHAALLHKQGYTNLIVAGGSDRAKEYHNLLNKYNGKFDAKGNGYKFKKITVASTGERKEGISGSDMRDKAKNNDYDSFKSNLPSHLQKNEKYSKELFHDVRKGMGIHENVNRGLFKAIFLVGGPGSGKDVIIHEAVAEKNAVEINANKAYDFLIDKKRLSEETKDFQLNAIRSRSALIINGASDDSNKIAVIKEELDELGYITMMVFVNTTNEVSQDRNIQHSRVISEQIRNEKWIRSRDNINYFYDLFEYFLEFDNSINLQSSNIFIREQKQNEISDICKEISHFFKSKAINENARAWLRFHGKLNINEDVVTLFQKDDLNENYSKLLKKHDHQTYSTLLQKHSITDEKIGPDTDHRKPINSKSKIIKDNNAPIDQFLRKAGKIDSVKDGDIQSNSDYIFRTYEEKQQSQPTLKVYPKAKVSNFDTDKETQKLKTKAGVPLLPGKVMNGYGIGDTYDTRTSGSVYPMSGLGNATYRESFNSFKSKLKKEAIDDPGSSEMGTFGGIGNGVNKEPMQTPLDKFVTSGPEIKQKKKLKEASLHHDTPESLAKKHGVNIDLINKQIKVGTGVEHEHTKNNKKALRIAMDHVAEFPDYYTRLLKMEKQAKKQEK